MQIVLVGRDKASPSTSPEERSVALSGWSDIGDTDPERAVKIEIKLEDKRVVVDCYELKTTIEALEKSVRQGRKL